MRRIRRPLLLLAAAAVVTSAVALGAPTPPARLQPAAAAELACPPGTLAERDVPLEEFARGATSTCVPALHPEPTEELFAMNAQLTARHNGGYPVMTGALEAAVAQHQALARQRGGPTDGRWSPLGTGPLLSDVAGYPSTNSTGLQDLAGRVEDLAGDPANPAHWFAAVANGGVWETTNAGGRWRAVGDALPTQVTGAVAYLSTKPAATLLAGTGDPAFGGSSTSGMGVFWSRDGGRSWRKASGVPAGTLSFAFGHDPARPAVVYAATSKGLFRSTDGGRSFRNMGLPTSCLNAGAQDCFFANIVTDVVVRPADRDGKGGGAVLAAVGWRAGTAKNQNGKPQSPHNGLYTSATGAPGSFRYLSNPPGFTPDGDVGRTALTVAGGPRQDHDYVYAVVQNARKFNGGAPGLDMPDAAAGKAKPAYNTVLDGVYGSKDFGATWTKMAGAEHLQLPGTGTALSGAFAATYAPGVQSWYNAWISVDPTRTSEDGVPTRLAFGLEEVWTGSGELPPVPGASRFTVAGKYFAGSSCGGLNLPSAQGYCPTGAEPTKPQGSTTHPDQHAGLWVPDRHGGVTLVVGNDGGTYKQALARDAELSNSAWGRGIQNGFHTLMPYDAAMSDDGTVVMGLQDNGSVVIEPEGRQIMAYGGDGFFVAVDPENSKVWWEEYVYGSIRVTKDGGKTWRDVLPPDMTGALFGTPFAMDPDSSKHLVIGARKVWETTAGANTTTSGTNESAAMVDVPAVSSTDWKKVFDLGTREHPGDANAVADAATDPANGASAIDTVGDATYVGFCGTCDIATGGRVFGSGIATNVAGDRTPKKGTDRGWHVAAAKGLPKRYINSVRIDPANDRTVYVTLGGYGRRWIPPGALGDDRSKVGTGHVFKSTDAGATFRDISGNLPDVAVNDAFPFGGGLVVATDLGVYWTGGTNGGTYRVLGRGLPSVPTFRLNRTPRSAGELVAATYGRGAYLFTLPGKPAPGSNRRAPEPAAADAGSDATRTGVVDPTSAPADPSPAAAAAGRVRLSGRSVPLPVAGAGLLALSAALVGALLVREQTRRGRRRP